MVLRRRQRQSRLCGGRAFLAALAFALFATPARALGEGAIQNGLLDLLVYFAYDEDDPSGWEPVFTEYSRLLLNATEGGLQLGTVSFTKCEDLKNQADVWVLNDFSGARAHLAGLGVNGRHITISQIHELTSGGVRGQFGLAHETGHYVWAVYDEYKGYVGSSRAQDPLHFCVSDASPFACLMDGGTTIVPNNQRTEFCTRPADGFPGTSHFAGANNAQGKAVRNDQEYILGRSCWEQIERFGAGDLVHPSSAPAGSAPPHQPVVFDVSRFEGNLAMALVIDTSGSMADGGKLALAVQSSQAAIGLLQDEDWLTIVTFDDAPRVLVPLRKVDDDVKDDAIALLDTLTAGGGTAAGEAVLRAASQLAEREVCKEFLILLSDGISAAPLPDDPSVLAALNAQRVQGFGVALGAFPDEGPLITLSTATGGVFVDVPIPVQLPGAVSGIVTAAGAGTTVTGSAEETIEAGEELERTFEVSAFATDLRVSLSFPKNADVELSLFAPDGTEVPFAAPPAEAIVYESAVQKTLLLPAPDAGEWRARLHEAAGVASPFDLHVFVESPDLDVSMLVPEVDVAWPAPMRVETVVVAGVPVGGAQVTADVLRPDGTRVTIGLFDDGLEVHGDTKAEDGVYSSLFTRFAGDGPYAFDVFVRNENGVAASNQECGVYGLGEEGQVVVPIAPFVACLRRTLLLSGAPPAVSVGAGTLEPHAGLSPAKEVVTATASPTPVAGFTLEASSDEPAWLERVRFDVSVEDGAVVALEELSLHVDADGDGVVDRPSVPLARGRVVVTATSGTLSFERDVADLALLGPGLPTTFLVSAGESLAVRAEGSAGAAGGRLGAAPPWWMLPPLVLLVFLVRQMRRIRQGAAWRPRLALAGGLALVLAGSCRSGSDDESSSGSFTLHLQPSSVELRGASSAVPLTVSGSSFGFSFDLD